MGNVIDARNRFPIKEVDQPELSIEDRVEGLWCEYLRTNGGAHPTEMSQLTDSIRDSLVANYNVPHNEAETLVMGGFDMAWQRIMYENESHVTPITRLAE